MRIEVIAVSVLRGSVEIDLVVHYSRATPVCCGEPACYVGFLGQHRLLVPAAIARAMGVDSPVVAIRAQLRHEPGFRYIDHATGRMLDEGVDQIIVYGAEHFRA